MSASESSPTVMACGIGSVNTSQYTVKEQGEGVPKIQKTPEKPVKPTYRVPSMEEIAALPHNGLTVASTFSGCGGSSLGYRIAGFKVLWASEFIEAARDSYVANTSAGTILDARDIRTVKPEEILRVCKLKKGQLDLLDGSPPCSSFSTAGKRQEGWGQEKKYSDTVQRTDDLFFEFVRILRGLKPKTFVAENVSGLVKGTAKGYFLEILKALKDSGYRVKCKVLDAQWLGVPQMRQRTIFVGVRNDLKDPSGNPIEPAHPSPLPARYSVREAIPWITGLTHDSGGLEEIKEYDVEAELLRTDRADGGGNQTRQRVEVSEDTYGEHRVYTDKPGPSVRAKKVGHIKVTNEHPDGTKSDVPIDGPSPNGRAGSKNRSRTDQFIVESESDMSGKATGRAWDRMATPGGGCHSEQSEDYFQLVKAAPAEPCPTVTAAGGNAGLASVCHPTERRKFSIAELKRICAFPDDFVLTGTYGQMWERLGRAVPPVMMAAIARAVRDQVLYVHLGKKPWGHDLAYVKEWLAFVKANKE